MATWVSAGKPSAPPPEHNDDGPEIPAEAEDTPLEDNDNNKEELECVICKERRRCCLLLDCDHLCVCITCARKLMSDDGGGDRRCPVCRKAIVRGIHRVHV